MPDARRALAAPNPLPHPVAMGERVDENRFRHLPEPVRSEDLVETVDVSERHEIDTETQERERLLRQAGGV
jgi:hypothetical protein